METATIETKSDYDRNFAGCVLGVSERNGYHDSDFFATVWDEEQGCVRTIEDGTTRFYAPSKYSRADATNEVRTKARNWWASTVGPRTARATLMGQRVRIDVGAEVEVVKGKKVAKGTKGIVCWMGEDAFYRRPYYSNGLNMYDPRKYRVGIKLSDGSKVFTSLANVMKLNVIEPTDAEISDWIKNNNPY